MEGLVEIKNQIRAFYPSKTIDLTLVRSIDVAKTVKFAAEHGVEGWVLVRTVIPRAIEQVRDGWFDIERTAYWNDFIDKAPDCFMRPGHQRTKAMASLFDQPQMGVGT